MVELIEITPFILSRGSPGELKASAEPRVEGCPQVHRRLNGLVSILRHGPWRARLRMNGVTFHPLTRNARA